MFYILMAAKIDELDKMYTQSSLIDATFDIDAIEKSFFKALNLNDYTGLIAKGLKKSIYDDNCRHIGVQTSDMVVKLMKVDLTD